MKKIQLEAEITARSYKRLMKRMRGLSRKELLAIMDHYIVHVLEDVHVEELITILDQIARTNTPITAQFDEADSFAIPKGGVDEEIVKFEFLRPKFPDLLTDEDIAASRDHLDLMFDEGYFDYLISEGQKSLASKLVTFAKSNSLPVAEHWLRYAGEE